MPKKILELPLANVRLVTLTTLEDTPRSFAVQTGDEVTLKTEVSSGTEKELRHIDRLIAMLKTSDLIKGYTVTLKDLVFSPEVYALTTGGAVTVEDGKLTRYADPAAGEIVKKTPCRIDVYAELKDTSGMTQSYACVSAPNCVGKADASFSFKNGDFVAPEMTFDSRPSTGESPMTITMVDALPEITAA